MEPRGCNPWQSAANRPALETDGKEGVDGSSPSEGFAKVPQRVTFCCARFCRTSSVRWVWSPLWSLQIENSLLKRAWPQVVAILFVTGEHAHSRYYSEDAYERAAEPKELYIVPNAGHVDLYDKTDLIPFDKLEAFFTEHLAPGARVGETLAASAA